MNFPTSFLLTMAIMAFCTVAQARVIYVNGSKPDGGDGASWATAYRSLHDALSQTASGDEVWVAAGTYFPDDGDSVIEGDREASFTVTGGVNLYGGFVGSETKREQAAPDENVTILSGEIWPEKLYWSLHVVTVLGSVTIDGVTVTKGNANGEVAPYNRGGGFYFTTTSSILTLNRCNVVGNTASGSGGGIYTHASTSLITVANCTFSENSASFSGGAIFGTTAATNCIFSENTASSSSQGGGAIWGMTTATNCIFSGNLANTHGGALYSSSHITATNCTFSMNSAGTHGGAIYYSSSLTATHCNFLGNSASTSGGAIFSSSSSTSSFSLTATNCNFSRNSASNSGGAIYSSTTLIALTATNCTFAENSASTGGAIRGATTATNCNFSGNSASYSGGTILGTTTATNCTFTGNSATAGGAIAGTTTATNCTFSKNSASNSGGAISSSNSSSFSLTATNCIFSENSASNSGGAIYSNSSSFSLTATNCTFFKNLAATHGGAIHSSSSSSSSYLTAANCTFSANSASSWGGAIYCLGSYITATNCTFLNNFASGTNRLGGSIYSTSMVRLFNNIVWHEIENEHLNLIYVTATGTLRNADSDFPSPLNLAKNIIKGGMSSVIVAEGGVMSLGDTLVTILTSNPEFVDVENPAGVDGVFGTADDGLRLLPGSPGIDMGLQRYLPKDIYDLDQNGDTDELIPVDLAGFSRIQGDALDLGAYESGATFPPIAIVKEPESMTLAVGMLAAFSVEALGYSLRHQWFIGHSGDISQPLPDATGNFLLSEPLLGTTRHWVRVSNGATHVDSQTATVTVVPVKITSQPRSTTIAIGATTNLSVTALGEGLQFQWYRGVQGDKSHLIDGATSPTYRTENLNEDAQYWVEITSIHGAAASDTATISVTEDLLAAALYAGSNLFYSTGGDAEWFAQNEMTFTGGDALRSGPITHNQTTFVETTVGSAGTISFWWRVSSQSGGDFLRFYINEVEQTGRLSGTTGTWAQQTFTVSTSGPHVFRWAYTKNGSTNTGSDCGWLDEVMWTPKLITTQPKADHILAGTTSTLSVATEGEALSFQWYEGDSGVMTDPIVGANAPFFTTDVLTGKRKFWVKVGNGVGYENSETVMIRVYQPDAAIASALGSRDGVAFMTWGDQPWMSQSDTALDEGLAMQSGAITHTQTSILEAAVAGSGQLDFWWKVSSELDFDILSFSINGVIQTGISGEVDWRQATYQLAGEGPHRLQWQYRKDESKTSGSDRAWLDAVSWTPNHGSGVTFSSWSASHGLEGDDSLKTATPAKDGVSNLMKYALGLNPHEPSHAATNGTNPGLPAAEMDDDFMHFIFVKDTAKTDITYAVEMCENLEVWELVTTGIIETPLDGTLVRVTVSLPRTTSQFCRLKVSEN